ncbi:MAG: hypothetical protein H6920_00825 [Sphingomonadaceae bacterium]|jgi:hypothetical protein|nr:hypothetical protein [Sphingomonadaceae bacterium]MCB2086229.1 hypothetical protein [Sphingomonadaceae bacterium]MCP5384842.1 hypothetical protein [Altererythrobacter sp.]MCP5390158.1 hypothetical protein [Sphingomonadaceae bacterium]MCP5392509.1 hypothetical protein [Sphingomonadaceae bacterium]
MSMPIFGRFRLALFALYCAATSPLQQSIFLHASRLLASPRLFETCEDTAPRAGKAHTSFSIAQLCNFSEFWPGYSAESD